MPTPFMCHECDGYTMNISGVCNDCEEDMRKIQTKKLMSARKKRALINWVENHAKKVFKPRKPTEPSIKAKVGMEYKNGNKT